MPELWEACTLESRATLACLFKGEYGHWPGWDPRSGKVEKTKKATYDPDLEPEPDPELVREMQQRPHPGRLEGD